MKITKEHFGWREGKEIFLYHLQNDKGIEVCVMNYGATITSIYLPDSDKGRVNVVCGFNSFERYFDPKYIDNSPFFGAAIGRYCATIQGGKYDNHQLSQNAGDNNLHGGVVGFDKVVWAVAPSPIEADRCTLTFTYLSPDGDQGFPGNVLATLILSLNNDCELSFTYRATTDSVTPLSMTNHSYFNLSGFEENVENHEASVASTTLFPLDAKGNYSDNCKDIANTLEDLRQGKRIGDLHQALGDGMEHFYLFDGGVQPHMRKVAEVKLPTKSRSLEVFTTEGGMLLYTAKYTSNELCRESGEQYGKYRAFCCETHRAPNGPNLAGAPHVFLSPDETFESKTTFKFNL